MYEFYRNARGRETAENAQLEVYCPTNDDSEFPFNFDIDVDPASVRYIDLDEPVYGIEKVLDEVALDFDVKFSLKDEFKDFDSYSFQVFNSDYTEELVSEHLESGEVFTIPGLSVGTGYKISMALESEPLTTYYGGQFTIQAELDSTLAVDLFYQLAAMEGNAAPYVNSDKENDGSNNYETSPDTLHNDTPMIGSSTTSDRDYFKFTVDSRDSKAAKVTFTLKAPAGGGRRFEITNKEIGFHKIVDTGIGGTNFITVFNVPCDSPFIIKVTHSGGSESGTYTLTASSKTSHVWFSQYVSKDVDGVYWSSDKLDTLTYSNKPIFKENGSLTSSWFGEACGIVGTAMILRNMEITMNGYDFRTDYNGALQADPFTTFLASCGLDGSTINKDSATFPVPTHSDAPSVLYSFKVTEMFKINCNMFIKNNNSVSLNNISADQEKQLIDAVRDHKYVLIYFNRENSAQHFMVLTGLEEYNSKNPKTFADRATVYDPAALTYTAGAGIEGKGILLSQTGWYKRNYAIAKLSSARYYY